MEAAITSKYWWAASLLFIMSASGTPTAVLNSTRGVPTVTDALDGHVTNVTRGGVTVRLCSQRHLCRHRRCESPSLSSIEAPPSLCPCDKECHFFGDCCYDYDDIAQFSCHEVEGQGRSYMLVSACAEDEGDTYVSRKCSGKEDRASFLSISHVTSLTTGLSYTNIYCAVCNNETAADLQAWPVQITCHGGSEAVQARLQNSTRNLSGVLKDLNCNKSVRLPGADQGDPVVTVPRECTRQLVKSCPDGHALDEHCKNYSAIFREGRSGAHYRNQCALCNSRLDTLFSNNLTTCTGNEAVLTTLLARTKPRQDFAQADINDNARKAITPPISILLDFRSSNLVKIVREQTVVAEERVACPTGFVFDPFVSECQRLVCPARYLLEDNQCVSVQRRRSTNGPQDSPNIKVYVSRVILGNNTEMVCPQQQEEITDCLANFLGIHADQLKLLRENFPQKRSLEKGRVRLCRHDYLVDTSGTSFERMWTHLLNPFAESSNPQPCYKMGEWLVKLDTRTNDTNNPCKIGRRRVINVTEYSIDRQQNSTVTAVNGTGLLYPIKQAVVWVTYRMEESNLTTIVELETCEKLEFSCPLISLNKTLFQRRNDINESLVYIPTGQVFTKWEYKYTGDGRLQVCSFLESNGTRNTTFTLRFFAYSSPQAVLSLVGNVLSMVAAGVTFLTYFAFDVLRNHATCCIMNLVASLFMAQLLLLLTGSATSNPAGCTMVAALDHYFWLVNVFWTAVLAYDLNRTFASGSCAARRCNDAYRPRLRSYALMTWGVAVVIVVPCLVIYLCDCTDLPLWYGSGEICWIGNGQSIFVVFGGPVAAVLLMNITLFVKTVWAIARTNRQALNVKNMSQARMVKEELIIYVKISSLMGFTWIFGFAAALSDVEGLWYVFIVLNSCQGLLVFLSFTCRQRVRILWLEACCGESSRQRTYSLGVASSSASATRSSRV